MIPNHLKSTRPVPAQFLPPRAERKLPLSEKSYGGTAIADANAGMRVQIWQFLIDSNNVVVDSPLTGRIVLFNKPNIVELSGCFTNSMRPVVAYTLANGSAEFYWFDTTINNYTTTVLPAGSSNLRVALDDDRISQLSTADVVLAYVRNGNLYWREQRDRYTVEYLFDAVPAGYRLYQIGMNVVGRMQFSFSKS